MALFVSWLGSSVYGQTAENGRWSDPKLLFEDKNGFSRLDYMTSDASGTVHMFWSSNLNNAYSIEFNDNETVIYYQSLTDDQWLAPRDVLLHSQAMMPFGGAVDQQGNLHIATSVGGPPCLAHLRVSAQEAGNPRSWPQPACLDAIGVGAPNVAIANDGVLYAIYPKANQKEIAVVKSLDGGRSWSPSFLVTSIMNNNVNLGFPRLVTDARGRLHATWGELQAPGGYPWLRIMYARSPDGGETWSEPIALADGHQGDQNLTVFEDTVHAVWNGDAGYQGRYYRFSADGGATWSERITLPLPVTSGGLQGAPAIIVDNTGTAHILYTDSPNLYYITERDGAWSQPVLIAGPDNTGSTSEINYPMLSITEGNRLHALYTRDAQAVYYQERTIDAPYQAPIAWPQLRRLTVANTPMATSQPTPVSLPTAVVLPATSQAAPVTNAQAPLLALSIVPAVILVVGVLGLYQLARSRKGR